MFTGTKHRSGRLSSVIGIQYDNTTYVHVGLTPSISCARLVDAVTRFARQLQLVLALAVRAQSHSGGVSKTNAYINVLDAFTTHVLPEIQVGYISYVACLLCLVWCGACWEPVVGFVGCSSAVVFSHLSVFLFPMLWFWKQASVRCGCCPGRWVRLVVF